MTEPSEGLGPEEELLAERLAAGATYAQAAAESGISTKTVQRRMQNPEFAAVVADRRRARFSQITARLVSQGDVALDVLDELLADSDARVRLQAVREVLKSGRSFHREVMVEQELLARVEDVEQMLDRGSSWRQGVWDV